MNERRYMLLALMPPALVAILFAFGTVKERLAAEQAKTIVSSLAKRFPPIGDLNDSPQIDADVHAKLWELSVSGDELERRLNAFTEEDYEQRKSLIKAGEPWEAGPIVLDIAKRAEPIVAEFERLLESESPSGTIRYFSFDELLITQLRAAVYENDRELALRSLRRMHDFSTADLATGILDYQIIKQYKLIQQSLAIGFWERSEDLSAVQKLVSAPLHLEQRWDATIRRQLTQLRESLDRHQATEGRWRLGFNTNFVSYPGESGRYSVNRSVHAITAPGDLGSMRRARELHRFADRKGTLETMTLIGIPFADSRLYDVVGYGYYRYGNGEFASEEFYRRITLTAIGVKQFQIQEGRWPKDLAELSRVGLTPQDWCYEPAKAFFFEASDERNEAIVWVDRQFQDLLNPPPVKPEPSSPNYPRIFNRVESLVR